MMAELLDMRRGTKNQIMVKVENTHLKMPLSIVTGRDAGPTILVTTGLHGGEYPGTLATIELIRELDPEQMRGRLMALHPVNTQAFRARAALMLPEDGRNLNEAFPGRPDGGAAEKVAWRVTEFQDLADFYFDLHSGDLHEDLTPYVYYPEAGDEKVRDASRQAARVVDVPWMTRCPSPNWAIASAAQRGTPALLLERGGAGACRRLDVDLYKKDLSNLFKHVGLLAGPPELPASPPAELAEVTYVESQHSALWQAAVEPGQQVAAGQKLGELLDYFGELLETPRATRDGVVLYRLRTLAANAGDVLVAY